MVSKKIVLMLLVLAILFTVVSITIIATHSNSLKSISDNNLNPEIQPAVESGKVSLIINTPPKTK